jgi:hypothetical protein
MKPFTDPFPFRNPETRSSIGEVIAEITKAELKAAEAQDLKELPGAAGEAAHKRLHKTIGKFLKAKPVQEGKKGVGAYTVIKKSKTVQKGSAADSTPDTTTTEYDVTKRGVKVGSAQRDNYFGQTSGTVHGKRFSGTGSAQTDLHRFLKSKRGATVREEVDHELDEGLLAKAGAVISKKWKSVKDDYSDWRTVREQIKQTKKELAAVKKEIATADSARDVWARGKLKELDAQLERLKNEEKERLKAEKGATVREGVVVESHTRAQLEKMTTTRLRELKKKYEGLVLKGDRDAARELADIRGLLRAKGAGVVLDEASTEVVKARLAARGEKRGGGAAQNKAADAVQVRLQGKTKP